MIPRVPLSWCCFLVSCLRPGRVQQQQLQLRSADEMRTSEWHSLINGFSGILVNSRGMSDWSGESKKFILFSSLLAMGPRSLKVFERLCWLSSELMVLFKLAACVTLIFLLKFLEGAAGSEITCSWSALAGTSQRLLLASKTLNGLWLGSMYFCHGSVRLLGWISTWLSSLMDLLIRLCANHGDHCRCYYGHWRTCSLVITTKERREREVLRMTEGKKDFCKITDNFCLAISVFSCTINGRQATTWYVSIPPLCG